MHRNVVRLHPVARPVERVAVLERLNQFELYQLGCALHPLAEASGDLDPWDLGRMLNAAAAALARFLSDDPPLRLMLSKPVTQELASEVDALRRRLFPQGWASAVSDKTIPSYELSDVRTALESFEAVLRAEMQAAPAFAAPKRGIYDTEDLVNAAERALPPMVAAAVSDKARSEIASAGRCLAFGLFTAAGFHVCRAVEAVLESYYQRFAGKAGELRSWHDYIRELEKLAKSGASPAPEAQTVAYIDQLRQSNRNPIMHPRVVLAEEDAFMVFDLGKAVICRMAQELNAAGPPVAAAPVVSAAGP